MCALIASTGIKHPIKLELHKSIFFSHKCYKMLDHNKWAAVYQILVCYFTPPEHY